MSWEIKQCVVRGESSYVVSAYPEGHCLACKLQLELEQAENRIEKLEKALLVCHERFLYEKYQSQEKRELSCMYIEEALRKDKLSEEVK